MTNKIIGSRAAVTLLAGIVLLLTMLLLVSLQTSDHLSTANGAVPLSEFGFKEYVKQGPFVINVDEGFPAKRKYMFLDQDGHVSLTNDNGEVILNLDSGFSVVSSFDPEIPGRVSEYSVTIKGIDFMDLDVNRSFDYRVALEAAKRVDVWYENAWCETVLPSGDKYKKQLVSGETVAFDKKTGKWSPTSEP